MTGYLDVNVAKFERLKCVHMVDASAENTVAIVARAWFAWRPLGPIVDINIHQVINIFFWTSPMYK